MLFAVKCSRDINEYVEYHKDFGDGLEFFKPRARDYALLRINKGSPSSQSAAPRRKSSAYDVMGKGVTGTERYLKPARHCSGVA